MTREPKRSCLNCGAPIETNYYCDAKCSKAFANRRMQRGAAMYDLVMAIRFEREEAEKEHLWSMLCRLASDYRDEDQRERDGLKSWAPWQAVLRTRPHLRAKVQNGVKP